MSAKSISFAGPLGCDGTFQAEQLFGAGFQPSQMEVVDFNRDTVPDLVIANFKDVLLLLGKGDGAFQRGRQIVAGRFLSANRESNDLSILLGKEMARSATKPLAR